MSGKFIISGEDVVKGREARDNVQRTYRFLPDYFDMIKIEIRPERDINSLKIIHWRV